MINIQLHNDCPATDTIAVSYTHLMCIRDRPVITPLGQPLAPAGSAVTRQLINRMKLYRVESVSYTHLF